MRHTKLALALGSISIAVVLGAFVSAAQARVDSDAEPNYKPSLPTWVNEDGSIDMNKMPSKLPLLDAHGEVCGYIASEDLFAPNLEGPLSALDDGGMDVTRKIVEEEDGTRTEVIEAPFTGPAC